MEQPPILHKLLSLSLLLLLNCHLILSLTTPTPPPTLPPTPSPTTPTSKSTLDPKQIRALQSLNIPTTTDPCSNPRIPHATAICDTEKPFRHLTSLHLFNCSTDVSLSITALKSLSTLKDLSFTNCPAAAPASFPPELASNLQSFTCINSLRKLTGVMLGRLQNVTDLTISSVPIKGSGPYVILGNLKNLKKLTLSHTNLTGYIPKSFQSDLTHIDLSNNQLKGSIRSSVTDMDTLVSLDLSSNQFNGELPTTIGDLIALRNLSVSSNSLSGPIPGSMASMPELEYVDLSSNQFNGSIPNFFSKMKNLKHLNLESNNFQGIMPFNESFIKKLVVFKIGENDNLCYNHTTFSAKIKLGIAKCDKNGYPVSPPTKSVSSGDDEDYSDDSSQDETSQKSGGHHGPNKVVLGVAIALSSIVFLIIFLIFLSKRCV